MLKELYLLWLRLAAPQDLHKLGTVPRRIITALRTLSDHILAKELTQSR